LTFVATHIMPITNHTPLYIKQLGQQKHNFHEKQLQHFNTICNTFSFLCNTILLIVTCYLLPM